MISRMVCEAFGFHDAGGRLQRADCMKPLRFLEAERRITLPTAQRSMQIARPWLLDAPVPEPLDVPNAVKGIKALAIILVTSAADRAIWNTLMDREHSRGTTTFAGGAAALPDQECARVFGRDRVFSVCPVFEAPGRVDRLERCAA